MEVPVSDSTTRFSNRAAYYAECRPKYSAEVIPYLAAHARLSPESVIADIGAGTGISSELFLPHCKLVYGVEPNAAMRGVAERLLSRYSNFSSVDGTAKGTHLPNAAANFVVVGSAFHWFDKGRCRIEFRRILKDQGALIVLTNRWRKESSRFMHDVRELFRKYADPRIQPRVENAVEEFMRPKPVESAGFDMLERLDFSKLSGRLLSYSVIPLPREPRHTEMMQSVRDLFDRYETNGQVDFLSETKVYWGLLT